MLDIGEPFGSGGRGGAPNYTGGESDVEFLGRITSKSYLESDVPPVKAAIQDYDEEKHGVIDDLTTDTFLRADYRVVAVERGVVMGTAALTVENLEGSSVCWCHSLMYMGNDSAAVGRMLIRCRKWARSRGYSEMRVSAAPMSSTYFMLCSLANALPERVGVEYLIFNIKTTK